jgi:phosphoglycerate dehydrogenase-like enzyme
MNAGRTEKVRVFSAFPGSLVARVEAEVAGAEIVELPSDGPPGADLSAEVLLTPPWDPGHLAEILECGVDWVHTIGTGVDGFPFALLNGRQLTCARGASAIPISEWILAMMLAFEKRLPQVWLEAASAKWKAPEYDTLGGLFGKTLGLVGFGAIGERVARHALLFGMRVCAVRKTDRPFGVEGVERVPNVSILLRECDHVVLVLPSTPDSHHLIDREALAELPENAGVHLVNVSRGELIDQEALREALDDGRVASASLDVADPEPPPEDHWLYTHPKVRLSPHISWNMPQAFDWLLDTFIENLRRYQAGAPLEGVVDLEAGY